VFKVTQPSHHLSSDRFRLESRETK